MTKIECHYCQRGFDASAHSRQLECRAFNLTVLEHDQNDPRAPFDLTNDSGQPKTVHGVSPQILFRPLFASRNGSILVSPEEEQRQMVIKAYDADSDDSADAGEPFCHQWIRSAELLGYSSDPDPVSLPRPLLRAAWAWSSLPLGPYCTY